MWCMRVGHRARGSLLEQKADPRDLSALPRAWRGGWRPRMKIELVK